jgi:hypothetical protein
VIIIYSGVAWFSYIAEGVAERERGYKCACSPLLTIFFLCTKCSKTLKYMSFPNDVPGGEFGL